MRGIGVLEDHLHLLAHGDHAAAVELGEVHALEQDLAGGRVVEPQHQAAERGFPAARFADQAQRLAAPDVDRHIIDGAHELGLAQPARTHREELLGPLDGEDAVVVVAVDGGLARRLDPAVFRIDGLDFGHAVAGGEVPRLHLHEGGILQALVDDEAAARAEAAARRRVEQVGRRPVDGGELGVAAAIEARHGRQQPARVGVERPAEHALGGAALDQARRIHDVHAVGVAGDDAEVVGDDDDRHAEPAGEVLHQLQDLRLDGDVERGGGLVRDQELGIAGKPDGDHHALAHTARQLMRVLRQAARRVRYADQGEQLDGAGARFRLAHLQMNEQRLHDLQADAQHRVERGHRLLEDHGDLPAAQLTHLLLGEREQLPTIEADVALDARSAGRQQSHRRQCGDGFARTRLADDGHHLAGIDGIAQPFDSPHRAVRGHELHVKVVDLDDGARRKVTHSRCRRLCKRPTSEARDDLVVHPNVLPSTNGQLLVPQPRLLVACGILHTKPLLSYQGNAEQADKAFWRPKWSMTPTNVEVAIAR